MLLIFAPFYLSRVFFHLLVEELDYRKTVCRGYSLQWGIRTVMIALAPSKRKQKKERVLEIVLLMGMLSLSMSKTISSAMLNS